MRRARYGTTTALVGVGALVVAFLASACADSSGAGGTGGDEAEATPSATASTSALSPSPSGEPGASPSVPPGGLPELAEVEIVAGAAGRGLSDGVEGTMDSPAGVGWSPEAGLLYVVTFGSSSCPTLAESAAKGDGDELTVVLVPPPADAICTMDYAPTTTVVAVPDGADAGSPVTVTLGDLGAVEVEPRAKEGQAGAVAWAAAS